MTMFPLAIQQLSRSSGAERRTVLESMVTAQFRAVLLMADDEPLPLHESLFALGMSSVLISEVQQRLSILVGRDLSSDILFNSCTVGQVVDYLMTDVLGELFDDHLRTVPALQVPRSRALWDDVLHEICAETV